MKKRNVDVAIIGAGTAGLSARKQVAQQTKNYVVIDDGILGTTCARVGCMPSKVLIHIANSFYQKNSFADIGITGEENLSLSIPQALKHVRSLRDYFVQSVMKSIDTWKDEHLISKKAKFIDNHTLDLGDEIITAKKIIIATGSSPIIPEPWKTYSEFLFDTNAFFEMDDLPPKVAVIGLGVIGLELGQAMHRLGLDVTAIARNRSIAGLSDPKLVEYSSQKLSEELKIDFSGVKSLSKTNNGQLCIETEENTFIVDKALVSVGRAPNLKNLGLENTSAELDSRGLPKYHPNTFQVDHCPSIFIAGDANGERPILHETADEGAICGFNAMAKEVTAYKRRTFIGITFSSPNIAVIGQSYQALKNKSVAFEYGEVSFEDQGRARVSQKNKGHLRVYACKKTSQLLGAELFAPAGEHLAHLLAWVISQKMTVQAILSLPFYHPVIEEGLRTALRDLSSKLTETRSPLELALCTDHETNNCQS